MPVPLTRNTLFYGDNLPILREYFADEYIQLVYLDPPTRDMRREAAIAGVYRSSVWGDFPRIQILTIEQLLDGTAFKVPPAPGQFKGRPRADERSGKQGRLGI